MNITILTPHIKSEAYLAGCLKSVADQASDLHKLGISLHHHIQDGKSKGYPGRCDRCSAFR